MSHFERSFKTSKNLKYREITEKLGSFGQKEKQRGNSVNKLSFTACFGQKGNTKTEQRESKEKTGKEQGKYTDRTPAIILQYTATFRAAENLSKPDIFD